MEIDIDECYSIRYNVFCVGGFKMNIDEILKRIRKEMNISQEILARDLNVSYTTINRWENNKSKPSRLAMGRIKEYCENNPISEDTRQLLEPFR